MSKAATCGKKIREIPLSKEEKKAFLCAIKSGKSLASKTRERREAEIKALAQVQICF